MSLRGVVTMESDDNIGGFTAAIGKLKSAISDITAIAWDGKSSLENTTLSFDGIIQGDIKLQAINDWKTTLYYGFTDAAKNVGFSGTNGASIFKFANTVMNTFGYTLGGTGTASRKMYGGSNLNGFNVQFKWYTPYMDGWKDAINTLSYLAWPACVFSQDDQSASKKSTADTAKMDQTQMDAEYNRIINAAYLHNRYVTSILAQLTSAGSDNTKLGKIASTLMSSSYQDTKKIGGRLGAIVAGPSGFDTVNSCIEDLGSSRVLDVTVNNAAKSRQPMQLSSADIGSELSGKEWYELPNNTVPTYPDRNKLENTANATPQSQQTKEGDVATDNDKSSGMGSLLSVGRDLVGGIGDLMKGLASSFAANPPKVKLEIYTNGKKNTPAYRFTPLVITSFAINASRETTNNGDPLIVTIDIGFDYYQINSTGGSTGTPQSFAGVSIFSQNNQGNQ